MAPPEGHVDGMLYSDALDADDPVFESIDSFTPEAFERFVESRAEQGDLYHYELLNGRIVMTPPAGYPHGRIEPLLSSRVHAFVEKKKLGIVMGSSQGFVFPTDDVVEPDLSFVSKERWSALPSPVPEGFLHVVPDLLVEILSPKMASRDRGEKRGIYERNGVQEYWLVDHRREIATILFAKDGRFGTPVVVERDEKIVSRVLAGLRIPLLDLLQY